MVMLCGDQSTAGMDFPRAHYANTNPSYCRTSAIRSSNHSNRPFRPFRATTTSVTCQSTNVPQHTQPAIMPRQGAEPCLSKGVCTGVRAYPQRESTSGSRAYSAHGDVRLSNGASISHYCGSGVARHPGIPFTHGGTTPSQRDGCIGV